MPITLVGESQFNEWAPGWGPAIEWDNWPFPIQDPGGVPAVNGYYQNSALPNNFIELNSTSFGLQDGDFLITTIFIVNPLGETITPPDIGWVLVRRDDYAFVSIATYYKLITNAAGEPTPNWIWSVSAVKTLYGLVQRVAGVDTSGNPVRSHTVSGPASGTTLTLPQVAVQNEDLVYYIGYCETAQLYPFTSQPYGSGGYIQEYITNTGGLQMGYAPAHRIGNFGPFNGTLSVSGDNARMQVLVLKKGTTVGKVTVPLPPGGVQANDVLLASISVNAYPEGPNQVVPPIGWTKVREDSFIDSGDPTLQDNNLDGLCQTLFYKVATNSEPSSYDFTIVDRGHPRVYYTPYFGFVRAYRGVDTSVPIADSSVVTATGTPTLPTLPSVTASAPGSLLLSIASAQLFGADVLAAIVPDPPLVATSLVSRNTPGSNVPDMMMTIAEQTLASSGATGTRTSQKKYPPQVYDAQPHVAFDAHAGVIITGTNFTEVTAVKFNNINATSFVIDNDGQITANAPITGYGDWFISVENPVGSSGFSPYKVTNWRVQAYMPVGRFRHGIVELADGRVLMVGGHGSTGDFGFSHLDCYIYDPSNDTWASTGSIPFTDRFAFGLIRLPNNKVLLSGGVIFGGNPTDSCLLWDPSTELWTSTGNMLRARAGHTLTLLSNGKILAAGGDNTISTPKTSELYDPTTGTWGNSANLAPESSLLVPQNTIFNVACRLPSDPSNRVVVLGGYEPQNPDDSDKRGFVQIYTPSSNTWSRGTRMPTKVWNCGVTVLPDNRIVVTGGTKADFTQVSTIQIYDPTLDSWSSLTSVLPTAVEAGYSLTLASGKVLFVGGAGFSYRRDSFIIDVGADTISYAGDLASNYGRVYDRTSGFIGGMGPGMILLSSGKVLLVAGFDGTNNTDLFTEP